jgi:hypothetical protein
MFNCSLEFLIFCLELSKLSTRANVSENAVKVRGISLRGHGFPGHEEAPALSESQDVPSSRKSYELALALLLFFCTRQLLPKKKSFNGFVYGELPHTRGQVMIVQFCRTFWSTVKGECKFVHYPSKFAMNTTVGSLSRFSFAHSHLKFLAPQGLSIR